MSILLLVGASALAGPWVKGPGEAYLKLGSSRFASSGYVGPDGVAVDGLRYVGNTGHLYAEVGVAPHLQVVANLPFVSARNVDGDLVYVNRSFGDADLGLGLGGRLGELPVSLSAIARLPLYDNADLARYGSAGAAFPAMGDGQVDLSLVGAIGSGWSLGARRGWAAAELGYRHRTEWWLGDRSAPDRVYVDGLPWRAQLGWSPRSPGGRELGWLAADLSGARNLRRGDTVSKEWLQLGLGLGARLGGGLALELNGGATPWARASATGWSVGGGLSWSR